MNNTTPTIFVEEKELSKRYEVELISNGRTVTWQYNDLTLARQQFAWKLRNLDEGDELALYDLDLGEAILQYGA